MKTNFCKTIISSLLIAFLPSIAFAATASLELNKIYPKTNTVIANQNSMFIYELKNNSATTVPINITATAPLYLNYKLSTCGTQLAANATCRLISNFDAPQKPGAVSTYLQIVNAQSKLLQQKLTFNVTTIKSLPQSNANVNWQALSGPYGGAIMDIAIAPTDSNLIYAATYGPGIFKSTNHGKNWIQINNGLTDLYVEQLITNQNAVYALTFPHGIFKSVDQGAHWTAINSDFIGSMTIINNVLYAIDNQKDAVFKSTDGGNSWVQVGTTIPTQSPLFLSALLVENNGQTIYVGSDADGIYKSTNAGQTWTLFTNGLQNSSFKTLIDFNGTLYAGVINLDSNTGLLKSVDGGQNWTVVNLNTSPVNSLFAQGNTLYAGSSPLLTNQGGVFKTTDNGAHWTSLNNGLDFLNVLKITSDGSTLYAGTGGGFYQSANNGQSWIATNQGLSGNILTSVLASPEALYVGTEGSGIYKSTDQGLTWTAINNGIDINAGLLFSSLSSDEQGDVYALAVSRAVYKSADGGQNWQNVPLGSGAAQPQTLLVLSSTDLYLTNGIYIFHSTNGGADWHHFTANVNWVPMLYTINDLAMVNGQFYATATPLLVEGSDVLFSTPANGNGSWQNAASNLPNPITITALETLYMNAQQAPLYALSDHGVYVTYNHGQSWALFTPGLGDSTVMDLLVLPGESHYLLTTLQYGVSVSVDKGKHWVTANNGLNPYVYPQYLATDGNFIYAAGFSGIYRTSVNFQ